VKRKLSIVVLSGAVLVLAAGCGSEEPAGNSSPRAQEATSHEEFCNSVVAAETAFLTASPGQDTDEIATLVDTVVDTAPDQISDQVDYVADSVREAVSNQDDSRIGTDEFQENEEAVDQWVAGNCGFESVDVTAADYAFEGVPATVPSGNVTFNFSNEGAEVHEMIMVRYREDGTTIDDLLAMSDKEAEEKIEFLGASFGPPGTVDTETKDLSSGRYALVCFVPVGATDMRALEKADGPPHVARGMSVEFTVE
jgi:hypothetical protein